MGIVRRTSPRRCWSPRLLRRIARRSRWRITLCGTLASRGVLRPSGKTDEEYRAQHSPHQSPSHYQNSLNRLATRGGARTHSQLSPPPPSETSWPSFSILRIPIVGEPLVARPPIKVTSSPGLRVLLGH